jgi:hypothetical protein
VGFNIIKMEATLGSKCKKKPKMTINIGDNIKELYNKGAIRWLGFLLDSAWNFKDHYTKQMAKAWEMAKSTKRLHKEYAMTLSNIRKVTTTVI